MTTSTFLHALQTTTMLEIDGLHAWEFSLDNGLQVECMDGRARKVWAFTPAQVEAASFDESLQSWVISDGQADHRVVCLDAFSPDDDEETDLD
ncbi:DUF5629 family protein [Pseudomonas sp. DTU_2021_1001937_2_SI_NGA_ILE_001]|uniref:DUF5629 family protein n=1 Tax=Pseudomonas sp. DTU_2021_1001937_2_SI_NGA_ILE_001 TaxID=3077589 RepID=UPI0025D0C517|nr:DUF5629 family protein [Pseudomonas sp. DTU_2021_1001937_2_SI_NGA_ILE_001]WNW14153.1 DUF5629 family protein [Pseudomonas sp. DTU_2021_1001937_2_SI_NGA_ILE_001]